MSCIISYKGKKYSEEQFKEYFINNKQEFATSIAKNKDIIDSFKRKMEGIDFVFSQSPELASIGSKAQYLQYLSTIFPNSKVKDIVYHGTAEKFEKFNENIDEFGFNHGIWFTNNIDYAKNLPDNKKSDIIKFTILNIKNPVYKEEELGYGIGLEWEFERGYDAIIGKDSGQKEGNSIAVSFPEQIHILSSKKDLEMFRNFINFTKSEYAKYGDIQQFKDYIMSKNFAAIEEFLVVNNKIDRKC